MKKKQKKNGDEETYLGNLVENSFPGRNRGVGAVGNFGEFRPPTANWMATEPMVARKKYLLLKSCCTCFFPPT